MFYYEKYNFLWNAYWYLIISMFLYGIINNRVVELLFLAFISMPIVWFTLIVLDQNKLDKEFKKEVKNENNNQII